MGSFKEGAEHQVSDLKKTASQKLEGAKEYVAEKVPVGVKMSAEQTLGQAKGFAADIQKTAGQKIEGAKEFVSEKVGLVKEKIPSPPAIPEVKLAPLAVSEEITENLSTIPLPVEVTLVAKDNVVMAESLPNFTEPSKEGAWEEVKFYHTMKVENKETFEKELQESEKIHEQVVAQKAEKAHQFEGSKMVPVDVIPQSEAHSWPMADTIKLSKETAWTNAEKTKEIVQSLAQEGSAVLAEERK
jgi:hypothetical protein